MTKELVDFETAKLLKEKGFGEDCLHAVSEKYPEDIYLSYDFTGETTFSTDNCQAAFENTGNNHYLMPTIAQVVMWLYKKHGIWINTRLSSGLFWWEISTTDKNLSPLGMKEYSPTEAYQAAIKYCLDNLI